MREKHAKFAIKMEENGGERFDKCTVWAYHIQKNS